MSAEPDDFFEEHGEVIDPVSIKLGVRSAAHLQAQRFEQIRYVIPGVIPEGCTILGGRPKIGKSWFILDGGLAVARAGYTLGQRKCEGGDVLYLALEDNERRLQNRITKVLGIHDYWPRRFHYATEWPREDQGGLKAIDDWLAAHPNARMVIVDVLQNFRRPAGPKDQPYRLDYDAISGLRKLAAERRVAIVVVHHVRKGGGDADPIEKISGTLGLSGAADTLLVLDRDANGCTLYGRGRDIAEFDYAITFDKQRCRWTIEGDRHEVIVTAERAEVITLLRGAKEPMSLKEIADTLGRKPANIRQLLGKIAEEGRIERVGRGGYVIAGGGIVTGP